MASGKAGEFIISVLNEYGWNSGLELSFNSYYRSSENWVIIFYVINSEKRMLNLLLGCFKLQLCYPLLLLYVRRLLLRSLKSFQVPLILQYYWD